MSIRKCEYDESAQISHWIGICKMERSRNVCKKIKSNAFYSHNCLCSAFFCMLRFETVKRATSKGKEEKKNSTSFRWFFFLTKKGYCTAEDNILYVSLNMKWNLILLLLLCDLSSFPLWILIYNRTKKKNENELKLFEDASIIKHPFWTMIIKKTNNTHRIK